MADETPQKKNAEYEKKIDDLTKEIIKQKTINTELIKSQAKILEDAIKGAQDIIKSNEQTIRTNRQIAEDSSTAEHSATAVKKLAADATLTINKVASAAKSVGDVAEKVYSNAGNSSKASGRVLEMGRQAANVSNQMAIGCSKSAPPHNRYPQARKN